ncbi:MAG: ABC transporter substrate-binding protein [Chloroflexota bacterium]|nr:MAG: ABC transporter substrate-binding protein [Chloroflexota bacterium]
MDRFKNSPDVRLLVERMRDGDLSRRDFLKVAGGLIGGTAAASLLAACGATQPTTNQAQPEGGEDRVRLGFMTTISGIGSIHAPPTINAAQLAIDEINKAGGVLGKQVDLLIEDNNTNVDIAVQKGLKLVQQKDVAAFIDFGFSNSRFAVAEKVALAHKKLMLSPIFYEGGICNRYFFNISALPNQGIDPFVPWLMQNKNAQSFYGIGSDYAWGIGSINAVEKAAGANSAKFLGREEAPLGTSDWSAIIQRLQGAGPDVCFVFVAGNDLVTFLKQFFDFGLNDKIQLAFTFFQEEVTPSIAPEFRAGHLSTNTYFMSLDTPENKKFLADYAAVAGSDAIVTNFGEGTYDAIHMWAEACKKAGTFETEAVVTALEGLSFDGPQGKVTIDSKTHHATVRCLIGESTEDPKKFNIAADLGLIPPVPPEACDANKVV